MTQSIHWRTAVVVLAVVLAAPLVASAAAAPAPAVAPVQSVAPTTPKEMVAAYGGLADTILSANKAERHLVLAIVAASYGHAQAEVAHAQQALKGKPKAADLAAARTAIDNVAAAVGQIATEGDNAVAAVRKRLLEGGHHANAEGEAQGMFEPGYVVVTKAAKKTFLESSQALAMMGRQPNAAALDLEWKKVEAAWTQYIVSAK
jgi:hypothetical protein